MDKLQASFDKMLGAYTMYKGILYALMSLVAIAIVFSYAGWTGVDGTALLITTLTLGVGAYVSNEVLSRLYRAPVNSESWLITALILACIISPSLEPGRLFYVALCAAVAMASKFVITWRGSHFLNPAAFGAAALSLAGLLPATWWIACPAMLPIVASITLVTLYRHRKFQLFGVFALAALAMMLYVQTVLLGAPIDSTLRMTLLSWPIVFLGGIMLTEPTTLPAKRYAQLLVAFLVGVTFASQLHVGRLSTQPHIALLVGNVLALAAAPPYGAVVKLKGKRRLANDILELQFTKPRGLTYQAGQYMDFTLRHFKADIRGNRRTFSLVSAPADDDLRITVRTFDQKGSSFKKALRELETGKPIRIAHPRGEFVLPVQNQPVLFVAGGIGITPIRSMVGAMLASGMRYDVELVYLARSTDQFVYTDVFEQAAKLGLTTHTSTERLEASDLEKLVPDITSRQVYISGPEAMVTGYVHGLRQLGVPSVSIHTDRFSGY